MTREEEIADELKEEMAALRRRMERFEEWKESGYEEPCQEHVWVHTYMFQSNVNTHGSQYHKKKLDYLQEGGSDPPTYIIRFMCHHCGMTMEQQAVVKQETLFDEWQEYRENKNKGDEEE